MMSTLMITQEIYQSFKKKKIFISFQLFFKIIYKLLSMYADVYH